VHGVDVDHAHYAQLGEQVDFPDPHRFRVGDACLTGLTIAAACTAFVRVRRTPQPD
jgi:hypothetical protein